MTVYKIWNPLEEKDTTIKNRALYNVENQDIEVWTPGVHRGRDDRDEWVVWENFSDVGGKTTDDPRVRPIHIPWGTLVYDKWMN